jgi:hypothetical protein
MRGITAGALIVLSISLFGCATAGRDFARPDPSALVLGETTKSELVSKYGPPKQERTISAKLKGANEKDSEPDPNAESGLFTTLQYSFVDPMGEAAEGVSPQRAAYFWLWNDKLVGYEYISSFRPDSTAFRDELIARIQRNKSTEKDVISLLGQPSGYGIYPRTRVPGDRVLTFAYFEWNKSRRESQFKKLNVIVMPNGIVRDYEYNNTTKPLPPPAAAPAMVPIYVPTKR